MLKNAINSKIKQVKERKEKAGQMESSKWNDIF